MSLYLIIMGVQGAGKGVQAHFIKEHFGIPHVSTGDLFRAMRTREDDLARRVQAIMESGSLVDDDTTNEVLKDRLEQPDAANGVILDGYPRNRQQAQWLEEYLANKNEVLKAVLLLKLDTYAAFKRAFGRVTSSSGESYNIYYNNEGIEWDYVEDPRKEFPPRLQAVEKATGEQLIRRADDANAGAIVKRIDVYLEATQPLIEYYQDKGCLLEIDASQSIEDVSKAIQVAIEQA